MSAADHGVLAILAPCLWGQRLKSVAPSAMIAKLYASASGPRAVKGQISRKGQ
jgi:hypothetical protein